MLTGETGAGKSIIIGALSLILGQRADSRAIKEGEQKCVIEAGFDIKDYGLEAFFAENELDYDGEDCLIRRELTVAGKSRAFVNDTPVSLAQLRELSGRLIDIHSQHENLLLSNDGYQLNVVDTIARNASLLAAYRERYDRWRALQAELLRLKKMADKQSADLEYMQFQYRRLADAALREGEQEELEQEQETLSHAEEIKSELSKAAHVLAGDEMALPLLKEAASALGRVRDYMPEGEGWSERLQSAYIELKDIADEIQNREERLEVDPVRLEQVEVRLSELYTLYKKYRVEDVDGLIALRDELEADLQRIGSFDEEVEALERKIASAEKDLAQAAGELTRSRSAATAPIEDYLVEQLSRLGMPNIRFKVDIHESADYSETGRDEVQFLFSANKNKAMQPVAQVASGGEIARVMLSVKSMTAHRAGLPTIVFDEIDTGVSGEIAHRMGAIMQTMGKDMQVITITHLPQIAARGEQHYKVYKDESGEQAQTFIRHLNQDERVREIAKMLSGDQVTEAALQQAEKLMG